MSEPGEAASQQPLRHNVGIVFSEMSRRAYVEEAERRGEVYEFVDAWDQHRKWLKGEWAYLAPNALSAILLRYNIKHDILGEDVLPYTIDEYHTLFVPNAAALATGAIQAIERWRGASGHRLVVTGKTNLSLDLLGLAELSYDQPDGYTGWRWTTSSPFADRKDWEPSYLCGYRGYTTGVARAADDAVVLARLVEYAGDVQSRETAVIRELGDAIIRSADSRSLFIANQFLEFLGGVLQAHLNVETVRMHYNPTHWGDTLAYFFREVLRLSGLESLWQIRLRSFGAYDGVLQLRHDADHDPEEQIDLSMLEYEAQNFVPATHYIMDPLYCGPERCTLPGAKIWVNACATHNFIEAAVHNDSTQGDPPHNIIGRGLAAHVADSDRRLGTRSLTIGRHMGFLVYPETIDAMDYLYTQDPEFLGMCTFSLYDVIEYGDPDPCVPAHGKLVTYATYDEDDPSRPAAISGFWFPYHVVVATSDRQRILRGWDVTHDTDCDYDRIDLLFEGRNSRSREIPSALDQAVFTLHYEQQAANRVTVNDGRGHLPFVRYAAERAQRYNFWLANKRQLYQRLTAYEQVVFRILPGGALVVHNPTSREVTGLMVEVAAGRCGGLAVVGSGDVCAHVVDGRLVTLPPLPPGRTLRLAPLWGSPSGPYVAQPSHNRLEIVACMLHLEPSKADEGVLTVHGNLAQRESLLVRGLCPSAAYSVSMSDNRGDVEERLIASADGSLILTLFGPSDNLVRFLVEISRQESPTG